MTGSLVQEDLHAAIESRVRLAFDEQQLRAARYGDEFGTLWRRAADQVLGGKLLRPRLLVEVYDALAQCEEGSRATERATVIDIAAAVEILHYAFLLHDDVIDGDERRRGIPNLMATLRDAHADRGTAVARHWGETGAILMGDLLLALVHQMFARAELDPARRVRLLDLLDHTITETVAGEQADVALSDGVIEPSLQTILTMTARKTATYTFEFPLRAAALLAGAPGRVERILAEAGGHLGVAFQLQDDTLSVFGDASLHGKDAFSDLREGKETVLIAYARLTSAWRIIQPRFGQNDLTAAEAAQIRERLRECGAESFVIQLVDDQVEAFRRALARDGDVLNDAAHRRLHALARRILGRSS